MFLQVARDQAIAENLAKGKEIARLQSEVDHHLGTIAECRERIQEDETTRRKLHNTIQELKGVRGAALVCHHPGSGKSLSFSPISQSCGCESPILILREWGAGRGCGGYDQGQIELPLV